jgi:hypothetical protein
MDRINWLSLEKYLMSVKSIGCLINLNFARYAQNITQSCQVSRFTRESPGFRADLQVSRLVLKISRILRIKMVLYAWISARPSSLLGKQSKTGNIRSTVGQYWLIIKKMGEIMSILWEIA